MSDVHKVAAAIIAVVQGQAALQEMKDDDGAQKIAQNVAAMLKQSQALIDEQDKTSEPTDDDIIEIEREFNTALDGMGVPTSEAQIEGDDYVDGEEDIGFIGWLASRARVVWPIAVAAVRKYGGRAVSFVGTVVSQTWKAISKVPSLAAAGAKAAAAKFKGMSGSAWRAIKWFGVAMVATVGVDKAGKALGSLGTGAAKAAGGIGLLALVILGGILLLKHNPKE